MKYLYRAIMAVVVAAVIATAASAQVKISDNRALSIVSISINSVKIPLYGKAEFSLDLQGKYDNAFDPDQIRVDGKFTGPDGKTVSVPGFYFQDYTKELFQNKEVLTPKGTPKWIIRFSPTVTGQYTLKVVAKDSTGKQVKSKLLSFECVSSNNPGFIRVSSADRRYFAFDNGKPYVPIGANVCCAYDRGTYDYDDWLSRYGKAKCSFMRLWLNLSANFGLERIGDPEYFGVGKYDLKNAWKLDYVMDLAGKNGIYAMFCLDTFHALRRESEGCNGWWEKVPYNAANGGPLVEPRDFWKNPAMDRFYKNRLRYLVARYGWNTHVMCWEFFNEVEAVSPGSYIPEDVMRWHKRMSDYLRKIDPWKHLRSTSFSGADGTPEIHKLKEMDFTQTHCYNAIDTAETMFKQQKAHEVYGKPHIFGEFGAEGENPDGVCDPEGIALHTGLWSAVCSGTAGPGMLWWWDNFIHPYNMYYHFAAISNFVNGIDFPNESFNRIDDTVFELNGSVDSFAYRDTTFTGPVSWNPSTANSPTLVKVTRDGMILVDGEVSGILHGVVSHPALHNPLTFKIDLPHSTTLHIQVTDVSGYGGAHLVAGLDGSRVLDKDMPDPDGKNKTDSLMQYKGDYTVDVPAGTHTLKVENTGTDWLYVKYILEKAEKGSSNDLRVFGMRGKKTSILWVQNDQNTWYKVGKLKLKPDILPPSTLKIASWPVGNYKVSFWDTYAGRVTEVRDIKVGSNGLEIGLPSIQKDIALKIELL